MTPMNSCRDSAFSGIAPVGRRRLPRAVVLEQRVELVEVGLLVERRRDDRLALLLADRIDDLVLEDAGQPRLDARSAREAVARAQRGDERLLHDVLGAGRRRAAATGRRAADSGDAVQFDGEVRSVQSDAFSGSRREY